MHLQVTDPKGDCQPFHLGQPLTDMHLYGCALDGLSLSGQQVAVKLGPALPDRRMAEALCLTMERWVQVNRLQPVRSQALLTLPIVFQRTPQGRQTTASQAFTVLCVCTLSSPASPENRVPLQTAASLCCNSRREVIICLQVTSVLKVGI